jgi:predicted RNA-binding protein YlxR (DUF448 family)
VTAALAIGEDEEEAGRARKCIVTGEVRSEAHLIRFVVSPDGEVVPDVAAKLPGRGMWVTADRPSLEKAIAKNAFSKAAKASLKSAPDLAALVVRQLVVRMQGDLGIARKAGNIVLGFDGVMRAFDSKLPPVLLVEAADGSPDGRRKLIGAARARGLDLIVITPLSQAEMSLALGRENVIHAALKPGPLAERLIADAGRLKGFRPVIGELAGPNPAPDERVR